MVDAINGSGRTIIITTKPKAKVDKTKTSFEDSLKSKSTSTTSRAGSLNQPIVNRGNLDHNMRLLQQQQMAHLEHVQEIAKQVQEGTYQMCSPEVLAEKILQVVSDKTTREKFIKKLLKEEAEKLPAKGGNNKMTELEMKKLVFMIKESQDEPFDDPELEEMLKEFA